MKFRHLLKFMVTALLTGMIFSCDRSENYSPLYSSVDKSLFNDVVFYITPYLDDNGTKRYVVADGLTDLYLKVGNNVWGPTDSYEVNSSEITDTEEFGGYVTTLQKATYPFLVSLKVSIDDFTTAGEYAALVRDELNLKPGSYICRIASFSIPNADGEQVNIPTPLLWGTLDVQSNYVSASLGEFEVEVEPK